MGRLVEISPLVRSPGSGVSTGAQTILCCFLRYINKELEQLGIELEPISYAGAAGAGFTYCAMLPAQASIFKLLARAPCWLSLQKMADGSDFSLMDFKNTYIQEGT